LCWATRAPMQPLRAGRRDADHKTPQRHRLCHQQGVSGEL
jgi:hypothetical protein